MHTKGKWEVAAKGDNKRRAVIGVFEHNARICDVGDKAMSVEEMNANAQLISAAPDLAEALNFCRSVIKKNGIFDMSEGMAVDKADAAMKKAGLK